MQRTEAHLIGLLGMIFYFYGLFVLRRIIGRFSQSLDLKFEDLNQIVDFNFLKLIFAEFIEF